MAKVQLENPMQSHFEASVSFGNPVSLIQWAKEAYLFIDLREIGFKISV